MSVMIPLHQAHYSSSSLCSCSSLAAIDDLHVPRRTCKEHPLVTIPARTALRLLFTDTSHQPLLHPTMDPPSRPSDRSIDSPPPLDPEIELDSYYHPCMLLWNHHSSLSLSLSCSRPFDSRSQHVACQCQSDHHRCQTCLGLRVQRDKQNHCHQHVANEHLHDQTLTENAHSSSDRRRSPSRGSPARHVRRCFYSAALHHPDTHHTHRPRSVDESDQLHQDLHTNTVYPTPLRTQGVPPTTCIST